MSADRSRIEVPAATGQQLVLAHDARHDEFMLSMYARTRSPLEMAKLIAFMLGDDDRRPRLTPPNPDHGEKHHSLWIGRACVEVTESTASTVKAWIDSRPRPATRAALPARELPADIDSPKPVERAA